MTVDNDSKSLSQQRFGKYAQGYVTSEAHAKGAELDHMAKLVGAEANWYMLDVATGGGHTALKFAPMVAQVVATDITSEMLKVAEAFIASKNIDNVIFKSADAENLPFGDRTFDLVTCRIAPHHFTDCSLFVGESARVLKQNGVLLVQDHLVSEDKRCADYVNEFQKLRDPSHHRAYSESEWIAMFQNAGLNVEHTEEIIKHHEFLPWVQRQECPSDIIEQLVSMAKNAPKSVLEWMELVNFDTPEAIFTDHHIIILGRKIWLEEKS